MNYSHYILFAEKNGWNVGVITAEHADVAEIPKSESSDETATFIATALTQAGYRSGDGLVLGLPSEWCLAATVSTADMPRSARVESLTYRLEEKLPVAAEDIVADFVRNTRTAFGVGVLTEKLKPIISRLESLGVCVEYVCPTALLAAQEISSDHEKDDGFLLVGDGGYMDVLHICQAMPLAWRYVPRAIASTLRELRVLHSGQPGTPLVRCVATGGLEVMRISSAQTVECNSVQESRHGLACRAGRRILIGEISPWIDFRRGPLASSEPLARVQKQLAAAALSLLLLLSCTALSLVWRGHRYNECARDNLSKQQQLFRQILPGQKVPVNVISRLQSEERRLRALSGDAMVLPTTPSSLSLLNNVLSNLPKELRFKMNELRLDGRTLYVEGETRSHGDAEAIASSIGNGKAILVDAAKSEQRQNDAVSFTITGRVSTSQVASTRAK